MKPMKTGIRVAASVIAFDGSKGLSLETDLTTGIWDWK